MTTYIYALLDPRDGAVRYVGKADDPERRFNEHFYFKGGNKHKHNWIAQLRLLGLAPEMLILEKCANNWGEKEQQWILQFRESGAALTNLTDGGEGNLGRPNSEETRAKISAALSDPEVKARQSTAIVSAFTDPEMKTRHAAAIKRSWADPETRARRTESLRAAVTPEFRALVSENTSTGWGNVETREKRISGMRKAMAEPDYGEKMSAAIKKSWDDPVVRERRSAGIKAAWARRKSGLL